jgi:hypothetical protein
VSPGTRQLSLLLAVATVIGAVNSCSSSYPTSPAGLDGNWATTGGAQGQPVTVLTLASAGSDSVTGSLVVDQNGDTVANSQANVAGTYQPPHISLTVYTTTTLCGTVGLSYGSTWSGRLVSATEMKLSVCGDSVDFVKQ